MRPLGALKPPGRVPIDLLGRCPLVCIDAKVDLFSVHRGWPHRAGQRRLWFSVQRPPSPSCRPGWATVPRFINSTEHLEAVAKAKAIAL